MGTRKVWLEGLEYVEALTSLCQRVRLVAPDACTWEASDLQWWWRTERPTDALGQVAFVDDTGTVEAAVVLTTFRESCQLDAIVAPDARVSSDEVIDVALDRAAQWTSTSLEAPAVQGTPFAEALLASGFVANGELVDCWMDPSDRPQVGELPEGFELHTWAEGHRSVHPLVTRNAADVAERLAQCSLYDPGCDLYVTAPDGGVCAYGLFWPDLTTGVGEVEPMRTEEGFEHRGIASVVLATGLGLLAERGCTRLLVGSNGGLYRKAGFVVGQSRTSYRREAVG
jgi:hypothetical protein